MRDLHHSLLSIDSFLKNKPISLLLDFDGTVSDFAPTPRKAKISPAAKRALIKLRRTCPIVIISGRPLHTLKRKVGIGGISYAGDHGLTWEIDSRKGGMPVPERYIQAISAIGRRVRPISRTYSGLLLEHKHTALTVHFRNVPPSLRPSVKKVITRAVHAVVEDSGLLITWTKVAVEFRPPIKWNKGDFAKLFLRTIARTFKHSFVPVYAGDEPSDEDAFKVMRKGITIRVGSRGKSAARFYTPRRYEIDEFLERLSLR